MKIIKQDLETITIVNKSPWKYIIWSKNGRQYRKDGPSAAVNKGKRMALFIK